MTEKVVAVRFKVLIDDYRRAMGQAAGDTRKLGGDVEKVTGGAKRDFDRAGKSVSDFGDEGKQAGADVERGLKESSEAAKRLESSVSRIDMGALGGAVLGAGAVVSLDSARVSAGKLQAQLGLSSEEAAEFDRVSKRVYRQNFGESMGEAAQVTGTVTQALGLQDDELEEVVIDMFRISDAFDHVGADTQILTQSVRTMRGAFPGVSETDLLDKIAASFQDGTGNAGDLADTLQEYPAYFAQLGFDADDMLQILNGGMEAGARNTDFLADAVKEFGIRVNTVGDTGQEAIARLFPEADAKRIIRQFGEGGEAARGAFIEVSDALLSVSDDQDRYTLGVELFGTKWEDTGRAMEQVLPTLSLTGDATRDVGDATESLDAQYTGMKATIQTWKREFETSVLGVLGDAGPVIGQTTEAVGNVGVALLGLKGLGVNLGGIRGRLGGVGTVIGKVGRVAGPAAVGLGVFAVAMEAIDASVRRLSLDQLTEDLVDLDREGKLSGEALKAVGEDFEVLGEKIKLAGNSPLSIFDSASRRQVQEANQDIDALDKTLVNLLESGHEERARNLFDLIVEKAAEQGVSIDKVREEFNDWEDAQSRVRTAQKLTADETDDATESFDEQADSVDEAEAAFARYVTGIEDAEGAVKELLAVHKALDESFGSFTGGLDAYESVLARKDDAERASATATAKATESAEDSWEDYYDTVSVTAGDLIAELDGQVAAQDEWMENLVEIARRGRPEVAEELMKLGPAGADAVKATAEAGEDKFDVLGDAWMRAATDQVQGVGTAMSSEWAVQGAIIAAGVEGTAWTIAEKLGVAQGEVLRVARRYGLNIAEGINPVLIGIGRPTVMLPGSRQVPLSRATGGTVPGSGDGDTVPAMLTPGEFVIRKAAVSALGVATLDRLNRADRAHYATGGFVSAGDVPGPPDVSGYGTMIGRTGGASMDHLFTQVRSFVERFAIPPITGGGSSSGLDPGFVARFNRYNAALGNVLSIVSGFRSSAQQARLYSAYLAGTGNLAAPPGRSKHERGLAIDHAPRSTAGMRGTASTFGLHYPVRGEPWHVEPKLYDQGGVLPHGGLALNMSGRPELVTPMADGGLVGGAAQSVGHRGALGAAARNAISVSAVRGNMSTDLDDLVREIEAVADAYVDLAYATDEATAKQLLAQNILPHEYVQATRIIIDTSQERRRAEEKAAEDARRAAEDDYRRRVDVNNNLFELGRISLDDHLFNLDRRMEREVEFSNEWMSLYKQRQQVVDAEVAKMEEAARKAEELRDAEIAKMEEAARKAEELHESFARPVREVGNLLSAFGSQRRVSGDEITAMLEHRVEAAERWNDAIRELSSSGLAGSLVGDLAKSGPGSLGLAQGLLGANVSEVNALLSRLDSIGSGLGDSFAQAGPTYNISVSVPAGVSAAEARQAAHSGVLAALGQSLGTAASGVRSA